MDKIFIITDRYYRLENYHASEVNQFLEKNFDYEVKSVTPLSQYREDQPGYYGMVIVVGKK